MASARSPRRQLAPTVGHEVALAGVHIRAGILDVNGERTVSALVQSLYNIDFINDNAGCFANGGMFPQNGRTIEFGSIRVYLGTVPVRQHLSPVLVAPDPPRWLCAGRAAGSVEVMMAGAVNTGKGAVEEGAERAASTRPAKPPLERDAGVAGASSAPPATPLQAAMNTLATPIAQNIDPAKAQEELEATRKALLTGGADIIRAQRELNLTLREYNAAHGFASVSAHAARMPENRLKARNLDQDLRKEVLAGKSASVSVSIVEKPKYSSPDKTIKAAKAAVELCESLSGDELAKQQERVKELLKTIEQQNAEQLAKLKLPQPLRRFAEDRRKIIGEEVTKLLVAGFIVEVTHTEWLANPVLVEKKKDENLEAKLAKVWRMCIDYTNLNKACPRDPFPLPRIDQVIDSTAGCELLSFLDAYSGFHQIPLKKEDQIKTAFITPHGAYCYVTMPFGLRNAGATYQRCMQKCLFDQIGKNVQVYVDDIVIKTKVKDTLIDDIRQTFDNLRRFRMKLNPAKCTFGVPAGKLLGFLVSSRGIEVNPADAAFKELKNMLVTAPILASPLEREPMLLYIAATNRVVSVVVVVEREEEGKTVQRPVYYLSEVLSSSKQNYPHFQKMTYGVFMAATKLKHYFEEHPMKVVSEAPISDIMGNKDASGRIAKWAIQLSPYVPVYERRDAIKSQALADFLVDWAEIQYKPPEHKIEYWKMHFDGSKLKEGLGAGVVLTSPKGDHLRYVLQVHFRASNNVAEYEALIHGLKVAKEIGALRIICYGDSDLVVQQCSGDWDAKDANMASYRFHVQKIAGFFEGCEFHHVPRAENEAADTLSKLGSSRQEIPPGIALAHLRVPSIKPSPESESIFVPESHVVPMEIDEGNPGTAPANSGTAPANSGTARPGKRQCLWTAWT
ncbi:hypothetical protein QYE76_039650 [Lolium multiflorum]|uniref:Uncharacterized protein n=1 Tax=Lolium multiflorum TaxID=4521 RepID=A0AAD8TBH7_LOLMU|nr:hypothetical protein QYE76_039650 [Lolium multiflorum]